MASDSLELFDIFETPGVLQHETLLWVILTIWSISLLQYTIVLPPADAPESEQEEGDTQKLVIAKLADVEAGAVNGGFTVVSSPQLENGNTSEADDEEEKQKPCCTYDPEIYEILTPIFLQDGPFVTIRLYVLFTFSNAISYTIIFFVCKNVLLLLLQFYRLSVIIRNSDKFKRCFNSQQETV